MDGYTGKIGWVDLAGSNTRSIETDENLIKNLNFVRSKRIDNIKEKDEKKILKTIFFWHYNMTGKTKVTMFIIFFVLLWVFASLLLKYNNGKRTI